MKKIILISISIFLITLVACKKHSNQSVTVIRDCTGTYLRYQEKDYQVCNLEKVDNIEDGTKVIATYKKLKNCNGSAKDAIVCHMFHENEGWIEIIKIN